MSENAMRDAVDQFLHANLEHWKRPRLYLKVAQVPRSLAKRTKIWPQLRELVRDIQLVTTDPVLTIEEYRASRR